MSIYYNYLSQMASQQKRKNRGLPSESCIDEESILDVKTKSNKSLLDFKSPKLSRLKNFIKNPVQKSFNRYKQFQDNDDDHPNIAEEFQVPQNLSRKTSSLSNSSSINYDSKDISQTSLLTGISTITDLKPVTHSTTTQLSFDEKMHYHDSPYQKTVSTTDKVKAEVVDPNLSHECQSMKDRFSPVKELPHFHQIKKSFSSSALADSQRSASQAHGLNDNFSNDKVDGMKEKQMIMGESNWNSQHVNLETTQLMLQSLDDHIKSMKEKIRKEIEVKEKMVDQLIWDFSHTSEEKQSKKIKKDYEIKNKNAEKLLEKLQMDLDQLEYKRLIVNQEGIPVGVNPAEYVKSLHKRDKNKKVNSSPKSRNSPFSKLLKSHAQKSASAENVLSLVESKSPNHSWLHKMEHSKIKEEIAKKSATIDESKMSNDVIGSPRLTTGHFQSNLKKPGSGGASSAMSWDQQILDRSNNVKKSKSNSMSSYTGREYVHEGHDAHESPKNHSGFSITSGDEMFRNDEANLSLMRFQSFQDDICSIRRDLHEIRSEFQNFQCDTDALKLDMKTHSELNSQRIQNAIERVEMHGHNLESFRQTCLFQFSSLKDEFRNLEEKLDYRLTTTRRDLQDNIDSCNNSISLIEKRTEQLPFMTKRSDKGDVKVITDHLCNLAISLIAFFMLLLSSGFHLLIKFINMGATISRNRNIILPPVVLICAFVFLAIKMSWWTSIQNYVSQSTYIPRWMVGL